MIEAQRESNTSERGQRRVQPAEPAAETADEQRKMASVTSANEAESQPDDKRDKQIQRKRQVARGVEEVLKSSLVDPPSLSELAQQFYISRTKLCCDFREVTGKSVGERLLELRIEEAKRLLTTTNQSIGQISHTVGYRFQSSFATAFSRETGRTPQQWRAGHRQHTGESDQPAA